MKKLSQKEAAKVLEGMKVKIEIPKAAVTQWKRNIALDMAIEALKYSEIPNSSDTISRQAAIDIIDYLLRHNDDAKRKGHSQVFINGMEDGYFRVRSDILSLPSVQPEIVPCGDCKHWICHDRRCGYWNHGVKPLEWCCHAERKENR